MYTTLIAGLCAYVVEHPPTTHFDEPLVVVGLIKSKDECDPVLFMFDDSTTPAHLGSPLGKHRFEAHISRTSAALKVDGRTFIIPRWMVL